MEPSMRNGETMTPSLSHLTPRRCSFRRTGAAARERGFTYLGLLIAMAIIGVNLAAAGMLWHTAQQRERERELLYVGDQIRLAIGHYYNTGGARQFPQSLDDLLRDSRQPGTVRYLRKLYHDPVTGTTEWGLIKDNSDRVMGVFSLSEQRPIKQANFNLADRAFEAKEKYSDWTFVYQPRLLRARPTTKTSAQPETNSIAPKGMK